jgi:hypothetical protein
VPRLRIHFSKSGFACFISHLDLPMLFGRAARRAGLKAEMTQGFSPHPRLALCPPLPVGVVAVSEPADFWFEAWNSGFVQRWNEMLPTGIWILDAYEVDGPSLNKLCTAASWSIEPLSGAEPGAIAEVLAPALDEMGALLRAEALGSEAVVAAGDLERCGPSFMVKRLRDAGVVSGWSDLSIARTAVGRWSDEEGRVIPLTEDRYGC